MQSIIKVRDGTGCERIAGLKYPDERSLYNFAMDDSHYRGMTDLEMTQTESSIKESSVINYIILCSITLYVRDNPQIIECTASYGLSHLYNAHLLAFTT